MSTNNTNNIAAIDNVAEEVARAALQRVEVMRHIERTIVGKSGVIRRLLTSLTAGGHVLLLDVPGVGKTALAKAVSQAIDLSFRRVQFTPDLLPLDVTGSQIFNLKTRSFDFVKGPVFTNLLLADEINRAPPKTQAALLEVMGEGQVTLDGTTHVLERPFLVVATMNPLDHDGTYALPQAQLDRFAVRLRLGFPDPDAEVRMLDVHLPSSATTAQKQTAAASAPPPALTRAAFARWQELVAHVFVADALKRSAVDVVTAMRRDPACLEPPSPRATLMWVRLAMAHALLDGRDHVLPADLLTTAVDALAHRIAVERSVPPEAYVDDVTRRVIHKRSAA